MKKRSKWEPLKSYIQSFPISEQSLRGDDNWQRKTIPYIVITVIVILFTVIFREIGYTFTLVNIALLYLLPVLIAAVRWGIWTSFYAAIIGVIAFDFFFVPPLYTYTVADARYLISFAVYLAVATFTASLASQLRQRFRETKEREAVTSALFSLSTQVAASGDLDSILAAIVRQSFGTFGLCATVLLPNTREQLNARASFGFHDVDVNDRVDPSVAQWVYEHGEMAGYATNLYSDTSVMYVPLKTESNIHGVMCFADKKHMYLGDASKQLHVAQALSGLAAVSIARVRFEDEAKMAHLTAESERIRTALLDSISHELRTPLTTITGAAAALMESRELLSKDDQNELLTTVREGAMRMNRLVTNLLGMVRLESGMLRLNKNWCDIADIVGVALRQLQDSLQTREVYVNIPDESIVVCVDDVLIEQVLVNLVSNAIKYSPDGTPIQIDAAQQDGIVEVRVRDWGMGVNPEETTDIFDKFYRATSEKSVPGTGLGLAICKGIVQAHGGEISASNADGGGLIVIIRLPIGETYGFPEEAKFKSKEISSWEQKSWSLMTKSQFENSYTSLWKPTGIQLLKPLMEKMES